MRRRPPQKEVVKNAHRLIAEVDIELALLKQELSEPLDDPPLPLDLLPHYERPTG